MPELLYYDERIAVAIKPCGVLSEGSDRGGMPALLQQALGGDFYSVHRLDRETGGVMVYARDGKTAGWLSARMQEGLFQKEYRVILHGAPAEPQGRLCDLLFRDAAKNKSYVVTRPRRGVREAILDYQLLAQKETPYGPLSLLRVILGTGRTHQIRVQFSSRRMPLFGDGRYGGRERAPLGLFACRLAFPDPKGGAPLAFTAPLPQTEPFTLFTEEEKESGTPR